jgi:hypothetical protein
VCVAVRLHTPFGCPESSDVRLQPQAFAPTVVKFVVLFSRESRGERLAGGRSAPAAAAVVTSKPSPAGVCGNRAMHRAPAPPIRGT